MTINKEIDLPNKPDNKISVADVFNIDSKLTVKGFPKKQRGFQRLIAPMYLIKRQLYLFWLDLSITEE